MARLLVFLLFISVTIQEQFAPFLDYPKGYFRNPLNIPINLSGNFGELRPNHYHMGLDLKTLRKENLPVYAAADGYVSRIKIEPGGFGRAIYIAHPNGYTSVYCHLNDFNPALESWVKQKQYELESWAIYEELPADRFPVSKGDFIAYSGNTGGSQAPHLHFELRRTSDDFNVNPMLFGFQLADNTRPSILRLGIYDRTKSVYEQVPRLVATTPKGNGQFSVPAITVSSPRISLAITAYDTHTGSTNQNGIFEAVLYENDLAVTGFRMDAISYEATRYLNAHIDFRTRARGGAYLQHLSELPGYIHSIYTKFRGDGVLDLSDQQPRTIRVVVKDAYGNYSALNTTIRYNGASPAEPATGGKKFYPMMVDVVETEDCEFIIGERTLYDSVSILHRRTLSSLPAVVSAIHTIGETHIPLQDAMAIRIRPLRELSDTEKERVVMQRYAGAKKDVMKVSWQDNWAMAGFRDFGSFQLVVDTQPPQVIPVGFTNGANLASAVRLSFTVKDNLNKWKVIRTELDGSWIRFTNDKGRYFHYRFDEKCGAGTHQLKVIARDEAGNETEQIFRFTR